MIYLLIIFLLIIIFINYHLSETRFLAPGFVASVFMLIAALLNVLMYDEWLVSELGFSWFVVCATGMLAITIAALANGYKGVAISAVSNSSFLTNINFQNKRLVLSILFVISTEVLYIFFTYRTAKMLAYSVNSYTEMVIAFKDTVHNSSKQILTYQMPLFVLFMYNGAIAVSYVFTYYFIGNCVNGKKPRTIEIVFLLISFSINFLHYGRSRLVRHVIFAVVLVILGLRSKGVSQSKSVKKGMKALVPILIALFLLFLFAPNLFHRNLLSRGNIIEYFAIYFGGGLRTLDLIIKENVGKSLTLGSEVLNRLLYFIGRVVGINILRLDAPSYYLNGHYLGNLHTIFKNSFMDLGILGVFFFTFIEYFVLSRWSLDKRFYLHSRMNFRIFLFAYMFYAVINIQGYDMFMGFFLDESNWFLLFVAYLYSRYISVSAKQATNKTLILGKRWKVDTIETL